MLAHDAIALCRDEARRMAEAMKAARETGAAMHAQIRAEAFDRALELIEAEWEVLGTEAIGGDAEDGEEAEEEPRPRRRGPIRHGPTPMWSEDRVALLRRLWPDRSVSVEDIRTRLNELPGEEIASAAAMRTKIARLRDVARRPHWTRQAGNDEARQALGAAARSAAKARSSRYHSPERDAVIRTLWSDQAITVPQMAERISAMPPGQAVSDTWVWRRAVALGLPSARFGVPLRRPEPEGEGEAAAAEAEAPAASPVTPGVGPLAQYDADELHDFRRVVLSEGKGARALHERFKIPLSEAQAIAEALRAEAGQEAA
jgi:hypothetical protein